MASLIGQTIAVVAGALFVRAVLARLGVRLALPRTTALAAAFILLFSAVSIYREAWHIQDLRREQFSEVVPFDAKSECAASLGVDPYFVSFVIGKVPPGERYWMPPGPTRGYAPDLCLRMLLIPRVQSKELEGVRWAVLWGDYPVAQTLAELRRRGGQVFRYGKSRDRFVVRLP